MREKDFKKDFFMFVEMLKNGENFSFGRFSDGELRILEDRHLEIGQTVVRVGDGVKKSHYSPQDHKLFDPKKHQFYRQKLIDAFKFKKDNYYKGLSCRCCVREEAFKWQLELHGGDDDSLTWANIFVNSNYPLFVEQMLPEFSNHKMVFVCNEKAKLDGLPFKIEKDFRIGHNAIINDYKLVEEIKGWMGKEMKNHVFIFSASSVSNYLAHQLFEFNDKNTYIDIGTTLNSFIGMDVNRGYLTGYWGKNKKSTLNKSCVW